MKVVLSLAAVVALASLVACGGDAGTAPAGSAAAKSSAAPKSTGTAKADATAAATAEPAKASAAASFPVQPLPEPFTTLAVGMPAGAKAEKGVTGDYATVETPDYVYKFEEAKENDIPKLKEFLAKAEPKYSVDEADGIVAELKQKDGTEWMVLRYMKVGDKQYKCSTTSKGAPKNGDKAKEAYDVCGTLKAK